MDLRFNMSKKFDSMYSPLLVTLLLASIIIAVSFVRRKNSPIHPTHCRRLGLRATSNVEDQYDRQYAKKVDAVSPALEDGVAKVKALHIFPIKSCKGIEMEKIKITRTGPEHDRQFSFAQWEQYTDKKTNERMTGWNKITQREYPRLVLVEPEVWVLNPAASLDKKGEEVVKNGGCLVVSFPRQSNMLRYLPSWFGNIVRTGFMMDQRYTFTLPLEPSSTRIEELDLPLTKVKVWDDIAAAVDMRPLIPAHVQQALKEFLGVQKPFAMFRTNPDNLRTVGRRNAPSKSDLGYQAIVGYADSYPLHILNLASVRNIASFLPSSFGRLDARRFRSNILVTGPPAHAEDSWKRISIGSPTGSVEFSVTDLTTRCQLPNVNPATGTVEPYKLRWYAEPFNALMGKERSRNPAYMEPLKAMRDPGRGNRCIDEGAKEKACLGMQMVPRLSSGSYSDAEDGSTEPWVSVGDAVALLETGVHCFRP